MINNLYIIIGSLGGAAILWILNMGFFPDVIIKNYLLPGSWLELASGVLAGGFLGYILIPTNPANKTVLNLGGIKWTREDFCRGWLITGRTGSGKTASGIVNMMMQIFKNVPNWGGLCVDQKGLFWEILLNLGKHYNALSRIVLLKVKGPSDPSDWKPAWTYNIIENQTVLASSIAEALIDSASARGVISKEGNSSHFVSQAKINIGKAIEYYRCIGKVPNLRLIYEFLTNDQEGMEEDLQKLRSVGTQEAADIHNHFVTKFLAIADEELSGVRSTIQNVLYFYTDPDVAAVFCAEKPSFRMNMVDDGKIVCVSVPQKFATERQLINTLLKMAFYKHIMERFDKSKEERRNFNLLILWADEAQRVVTKSEMGMADHNTVDQTREAVATVVFATQTERSFVPILGKDIANTLVDNLGNELIYTQTNKEDAEKASARIGERPIQKRSHSWGKGGGNYNYQEQVQGYIRPHELRTLPKFHCVIRHCEGRFRKTVVKPTRFTKSTREVPESVLSSPSPAES